MRTRLCGNGPGVRGAVSPPLHPGRAPSSTACWGRGTGDGGRPAQEEGFTAMSPATEPSLRQLSAWTGTSSEAQWRTRPHARDFREWPCPIRCACYDLNLQEPKRHPEKAPGPHAAHPAPYSGGTEACPVKTVWGCPHARAGEAGTQCPSQGPRWPRHLRWSGRE